jgi:hypothetical protein
MIEEPKTLTGFRQTAIQWAPWALSPADVDQNRWRRKEKA